MSADHVGPCVAGLIALFVLNQNVDSETVGVILASPLVRRYSLWQIAD